MTDTLVTSPTTLTADLGQYNAFVFHYTAPAGQQVVVSNPGSAYNIRVVASVSINGSTGGAVSGNSSLAFNNLQGTVTLPTLQTSYQPTNEFDVGGSNSTNGNFSFTGFTLTVTNIPTVPTGVKTYLLTSVPNQFFHSTSALTDPGAFVSLQNIPVAATPEPGSVALLVGMMTVGAGVLRRRRK